MEISTPGDYISCRLLYCYFNGVCSLVKSSLRIRLSLLVLQASISLSRKKNLTAVFLLGSVTFTTPHYYKYVLMWGCILVCTRYRIQSRTDVRSCCHAW